MDEEVDKWRMKEDGNMRSDLSQKRCIVTVKPQAVCVQRAECVDVKESVNVCEHHQACWIKLIQPQLIRNFAVTKKQIKKLSDLNFDPEVNTPTNAPYKHLFTNLSDFLILSEVTREIEKN